MGERTGPGRLPRSETAEFYLSSARALRAAGVPFLVGGAFALAHYTPVARETKDFDLFVDPAHIGWALEALAGAGYRTELTYPHWLGKAYSGTRFVDLIFSSANGVARVDDQWFTHAEMGMILGEPLAVCPAEETIWSKAFVLERERFDGADIVHLVKARAGRLDWPRLLRRFGPHWRVLFSHLTLFGFVYPGERLAVPAWVMRELVTRLERELAVAPGDERVCRGTLLSRAQYLVDVEQLGYRDARLEEDGHMSPEDVARWTAAIGGDTAAA